ncbi:uncharacterized protein M6B38_159105 [Iris pallida]|uniref:Uncharacterized protein n=1 Tax=Iris pallida TaxID=29817 RepID=A0AAX6F1P4_IRIPA|nr:uncharacterized protein M6B38_159105 [Iris pallida]
MESVKSIQSFWRRRNYRKIETTKGNEERTVTLGDGGRRTSGMKPVSVKNKVKISPPKGLLAKLRDSYVAAMFSWSGDKPPPPSKKKKNDGKGRRNSKARKVSNKTSDFDKRMILHIYNTVLENPRDPARITS